MTRLWDELEGEQLAGGYGLRHYLGSEGESAFFETAFGPDERRALLKVTPDTPAGEEQLARWRSAFELSNPHLLAMLDCGRAEAGGDSYLYAVFEFPDDNLAGALAGGALSEAETREVLVAALEALRYLHGQNMVHGAVDAGHVVAVGDRIKLSSDTVHASGHFAGNGAAAADDVRALGTLLYRMRTGRKIEPGAAPELIGVADPLATIIRHALEPDAGRRWSVREIDAALNPPAPVAEPPVAEKPAPEPALEPPFLVRALPKRSPALPLLLAAVGAVAIAVVLAVTQRSTPDASDSTGICHWSSRW